MNIDNYNPNTPLAEASTIPSSWYIDAGLFDMERKTVFSRSWQPVGPLEKVERPRQYITGEVAGEPVVAVRAPDGILRGFFNVCRHHAAAVVTKTCGEADLLRCPYHGWTYSLEGELKSAPDLGAVSNFDRASMGLVPVETCVWHQWVFVRLSQGPDLPQIDGLNIAGLKWTERRHYTVECNWKVFVDNYLDGGYHVPHLHPGLNDVLSYSQYTIENGDRYCLQSSPMVKERAGQRALYYWIYPNFMINIYEGVMDTNLVVPRGVNRTEVIFDFYFSGDSDPARMAASEHIQHEDVAVCESVQRGLASRAYKAGRLSANREAGEHLFHRLLYADLKTA